MGCPGKASAPLFPRAPGSLGNCRWHGRTVGQVLSLAADVSSHTYGICSNQFLDKAFKTVRYELTVTVLDGDRFRYEEDTQLQIPGQAELFHHSDQNTLSRVRS